MHFDNTTADRFNIEHAGIATHVFGDPVSAVPFKCRATPCLDHPIIEGSGNCGHCQTVPRPHRFSIYHGVIRTDMVPPQQRHPEVPFATVPEKVDLVVKNTRAYSHSL